MELSKVWLEQYEQVKDLLVSPVNFSELFQSDEVQGNKLFLLNMGQITFTTDEILVRDPLVWLKKEEEPYFTKVPVGEYNLETLVVELEEDYYRYIASRVRFNKKDSIVYHQALKGTENLEGLDSDSFFGFNVDAGLATIVDTNTRDAYCDFVDSWEKGNPEKKMYDDFFAGNLEKAIWNIPIFKETVEIGSILKFQIQNILFQ